MAFLARELSVLAYANGFAIVYLTKVKPEEYALWLAGRRELKLRKACRVQPKRVLHGCHRGAG